MRASRILIYIMIIIIGVLIAYAFVSNYKSLVETSTRSTHFAEDVIDQYVQREVERRLSMSIFLSIPHLGENPSQDINRLYAVSRLALIAMPPLFTIIPENLAKGEYINLSCRFTPLRIVQVNATSYEIRQGTRTLQAIYRFKVLSKSRVLYEFSSKTHDTITHVEGVTVYEKGYARKAVFNTTSIIGNETRETTTIIHNYYRGIMTSLEAVAGPKHIRILLDNFSKMFIIETGEERRVFNTSIAESLAKLLAQLPSSVKARVVNETINANGHRIYTVLLEINADVNNPSGIGVEARMIITLVEAKSWLLVEVSRHIEFFKAWMELGNKTYIVTGHNVLAHVKCKLS